MTLKDYLASSGLTQEAFAERAGLTQPSVSRLVKGQANVSLDVLRRVRDASGGAVTPNDFLDVPLPSAAAPLAKEASTI